MRDVYLYSFRNAVNTHGVITKESGRDYNWPLLQNNNYSMKPLIYKCPETLHLFRAGRW